MPEMRLRPGLRLGSNWEAHKPIAGFDGPLCSGGRKEEGTKEREGKGQEGRGGKGRGREGRKRRE